MPRKANEISVKWIDSKDAGKTNHVNVKHVIGPREEIVIGKEVVVKLNTRRYRGTLVSLLDWACPKKKETAQRQQSHGREAKKKTTARVCCNRYQYIVRM